jgi:hypothetical protein
MVMTIYDSILSYGYKYSKKAVIYGYFLERRSRKEEYATVIIRLNFITQSLKNLEKLYQETV